MLFLSKVKSIGVGERSRKNAVQGETLPRTTFIKVGVPKFAPEKKGEVELVVLSQTECQGVFLMGQDGTKEGFYTECAKN